MRSSKYSCSRKRQEWLIIPSVCFPVILLGAQGAAGFLAAPLCHATTSNSRCHASTSLRYSGIPGNRCNRDRWLLMSSETESRSAEEKAKTGKESVGSDEGNNWGMDDSIDVNAIRMEILEKAGYTKKGEDGGEEWITVDEDKSDDLVGNNIKDALTDSLSGDTSGSDLVEDPDEDEDLAGNSDLANIFDDEFDKGTSALRALANELQSEQANYAEDMVQELADIFETEDKKAAEEILRRREPVKAKLDLAKAELEQAIDNAEKAQKDFEGDFVLQLLSFRTKEVLKQAAFVGAVLIANQAVYQAILVVDDRGGNPALALGGLAASTALVWFYGYRPFFS